MNIFKNLKNGIMKHLLLNVLRILRNSIDDLIIDIKNGKTDVFNDLNNNNYKNKENGTQ